MAARVTARCAAHQLPRSPKRESVNAVAPGRVFCGRRKARSTQWRARVLGAVPAYFWQDTHSRPQAVPHKDMGRWTTTAPLCVGLLDSANGQTFGPSLVQVELTPCDKASRRSRISPKHWHAVLAGEVVVQSAKLRRATTLPQQSYMPPSEVIATPSKRMANRQPCPDVVLAIPQVIVHRPVVLQKLLRPRTIHAQIEEPPPNGPGPA